MTDLAQNLKNTYGITPRISNALKKRYGKNHRACFSFSKYVEFGRYVYPNPAVDKSVQFKIYVTKQFGSSVKIRNDWYNVFVYFDDLYDFLDNLPRKFFKELHSLEIMDSMLIDAHNINAVTDDFQNEIAFCKKLPFDKYRYQVYITTSINDRNAIGKNNMLHLSQCIELYDGIRINDTFTESHKLRWWVPETYFYSETLDWLPIIRLMEPRYIKKIKQFKTLEEVQNENSA